MQNDLKQIKTSNQIFVFSDKTKNIYKLPTEKYQELLQKNIMKDYKKTNETSYEQINYEASVIIRKNNLKGKIPRYDKTPAYVTIKDHKPDFPKKLKCRLINPSKTHIGRISKNILDRINNQIRKVNTTNQWKNTYEVLTWFKSIPNKANKCFLKFDVVDFYPSITPNIIKSALDFAKTFVNIEPDEEEIIRHSCKTLLYHAEDFWVKKGDHDMFDIPMGSYHGAEICELVGLKILHTLSAIINPNNYGLYRDDGIAVIKNQSPCKLRQIEKNIRSTMKKIGFNITIDSGLKITDFLDVTLDLTNNTYYPYKKPNTKLMYVNCNSNHPPHIIKQIPKMVNRRLCAISKNEQAYQQASGEYMDALKLSGYNTDNLKFEDLNSENKKRTRKRKIIYYNPPFNSAVKTNFGKDFINLVKKHFNKDHVYYKIFNNNYIKLSYSCLPNIKRIIQSHNTNIINKPTNQDTNNKCNCRQKNSCPLDGNCLAENIVYKATITTDNQNYKLKEYIGSTCNKFKTRYGNHKASFKKHNPKNSTELSKFILNLKANNIKFSIKWEILHQVKNNSATFNTCQVCNLEKYAIAKSERQKIINKRNELISKCNHNKNRFFFICISLYFSPLFSFFFIALSLSFTSPACPYPHSQTRI